MKQQDSGLNLNKRRTRKALFLDYMNLAVPWSELLALLLGSAVRTVQLLVDRGELEAWRTTDGHRRISYASVKRYVDRKNAKRLMKSEDKVVMANAAFPATVLTKEVSRHGPVRKRSKLDFLSPVDFEQGSMG